MDKEFVKNFLKLCLEQNIQQMLEESYKDYHVKGFNSIILFRSKNLTLRLYVCKSGEIELNPDNDEILVHNHSFDFQTQVLTGYMENAVYEPCDVQTEQGIWYQYIYENALKSFDNRMRLNFVDKTFFKVTDINRVNAGSSYFLKHNEFHRIFVPENQFVSMLFWQHQKRNNTPIIFSKIPQREYYHTESLYNRFSGSDEIRNLVDLVIQNL